MITRVDQLSADYSTVLNILLAYNRVHYCYELSVYFLKRVTASWEDCHILLLHDSMSAVRVT